MHPDAYKLMHYCDSKHDEHLYVWNARDGGAPASFKFGSRHYIHHNPDCDIYLPNHEPNLGHWVFAPAMLSGESFAVVAVDAPRLMRVDAALWDYFHARAEGFRAGIEEERRRYHE